MSRIVAIEDNHPPKDNLFRVEWNLGRRCNFNCSYCGDDLHDAVSPHMPWEVFTNAIDKIVSKVPNKDIRISFTGGEPFVHPKFTDMLEYAKAQGIRKCNVTTNGSPPWKIYERALKHLDYVIVSYHFERGKEERVMDNILRMHEFIEHNNKMQHEYPDDGYTWKEMHVHLMFLPGKLDECEELMQIMQERDIKYTIRRIRPRANADRTAWLRPYEDGMLGKHPRFKEHAKFEAVQPYYSKQEMDWFKKNA